MESESTTDANIRTPSPRYPVANTIMESNRTYDQRSFSFIFYSDPENRRTSFFALTMNRGSADVCLVKHTRISVRYGASTERARAHNPD
jgi:hypothetical protein